MKKFLTIIAITLVLLLASLFVLPMVFKSEIVALVTEQANANLNAEVEIGDVDLTLFKDFPNFTVMVQNLKVKNKAPFEGVTLADIKEIDFSLDLMSVLSGSNLKINSVNLIEPQLDVRVLADGRANYDIAPPSDEVVEEEVEDTSSTDFSFSLSSYLIEKANVSYLDSTLGMDLIVQGLTHSGNGDFTLTKFDLFTQTVIESLTMGYEGIYYLNKVNLDLKADLGIDLDAMAFELKQNKLMLNDLAISADGLIKMPTDDIDMDLVFSASQPSLKSLLSLVPATYMAGFEELYADGEIKLEGGAKGVLTDTNYPSFNVGMSIKNGTVKYPDMPAHINNINVQAKVNSAGGSDLDNMVVDVSNFHLDIANNPFDMFLLMTTPMSDPNIESKIYTSLDFKSIGQAIPMEGYNIAGNLDANLWLKGKMSSLEMEAYEEFEANGTFNLKSFTMAGDSMPYPVEISKAEMTFSPQFIELKEMALKTTGVDANMQGKVENYLQYAMKDNATLKANLNFNAPIIDLDALMGTEEEVAEESTEEPEAQSSTGEPLIPENIDATLNASIGQLKYDGWEMNDFAGEVTIKNGILTIPNAAVNTLGGVLKMQGEVDGSSSITDYDFNLKIEGLDVTKTTETFIAVRTLAPIAQAAVGKFNTDLTIKGKLDENLEPILNSLTGIGLMETVGIAIENFKPFNKLADNLKMNQLKSQKIADSKIPFELIDGKLYIKPFNTVLGGFDTKIAGSTGLDQSIDYVFNMQIPKSSLPKEAQQAMSSLYSKAGDIGLNFEQSDMINLDVFMKNTVTDPKITTSIGKQGKNAVDAAKKQLQDEFEKKKKEAEEKAKAELDKAKKEAEEKARQEAEKAKKEAEKRIQEEADKAKDKAKNEIKNMFKKPK